MTDVASAGPGRPKIIWTDDPDRFRLAVLWVNSAAGRLGLSPRLSERAAASNIAFLERTKLTEVQIRKLRKTGWLDVPPHAKNDNMIDTADSLRKKFKRLKTEVDSAAGMGSGVGHYFGALGAAIIATVSGRDYESAFTAARFYACLAGESGWFRNRLAPAINERFGLDRAEGRD